MNERIDDWLSDWLDNPDRNPRSESNLPSAEASQRIAESLLVHGLLIDIGKRDEGRDTNRINAVMQRIDAEPAPASSVLATVGTSFGPRRFAILTSILSVAAIFLIAFIVVPQQSVSAAMASLEKLVEAAAKPFDRTYQVSVVDEYAPEKRPRHLPAEDRNRDAKQQIDGATLYVRGANQYLMTLRLRSGEKRTLGCDGLQSWAFRETGPVHTSTDLNRFRGGVPGQQQELPFLNIHAHLSQLQTGYDIQLLKFQEKDEVSRLIGIRKSREVRGPKRVEIAFDADTGTVHEMLLDGLRRGGGGPKSVLLKLVDQSELPVEFFSHDSHHEPERRVVSD
ncbi:MAG: hypothetical protein AAF745_07815 [Planctomycetota bacterium]